MISHIFMTGATGFIGSHLVEAFLGMGYKVSIMLREHSNTKRIQTYLDTGDIEVVQENKLDTFFQTTPPDIVIHLATVYKKQHQPEDISAMIHGNIGLPTTLAQLCVDNGVKYFINTGTFFEYELNSKKIITENTPSQAYNLYASTKLSCNEVLRFFSQKHKLKVVNLTMFSPYGENDNIKLIPVVIQKLLQGGEISLVEQSLCFTYIKDIVDAYIKALKYIEDNTPQYENFNIASPSEKISTIVKVLEDVSGKKLQIDAYNTTPDSDIFCDTSKAKKLLGWEPQYNIKQGLALTYNYYKNEIS